MLGVVVTVVVILIVLLVVCVAVIVSMCRRKESESPEEGSSGSLLPGRDQNGMRVSAVSEQPNSPATQVSSTEQTVKEVDALSVETRKRTDDSGYEDVKEDAVERQCAATNV